MCLQSTQAFYYFSCMASRVLGNIIVIRPDGRYRNRVYARHFNPKYINKSIRNQSTPSTPYDVPSITHSKKSNYPPSPSTIN